MHGSKRLFLVLLAALILVIGLTGCDYSDPNHDRVREAVRAASDGEYQKAINIYNELIDENAFSDDPYNQGVLFYNRALVYATLGEYQKAVDDYTVAYETRPHCQTCLHNRSIAYEKMGNLKKAMEDVELMLEREPNDSDAKTRKEYLDTLIKPQN